MMEDFQLIDLLLEQGRFAGAITGAVAGGILGGMIVLVLEVIGKAIKRKPKSLGIGLIMGVIGAIIVNGNLKPWAEREYPERAAYLENKAIAREVQKNLPMQLDEITRLVNVSYDEKSIEYIYELDISGIDIADNAEFTSALKENTGTQMCNTPETLELIKGGRFLRYTYYDNSHNLLTEYQLDKTYCQKPWEMYGSQ